jgi:hypothetical protein
MSQNRYSLLLGVLLGVLLGAFLTALVIPLAGPPASGVTVPSHSTAAGTGCLTGEEPRAWVLQTDSLDHASVHLLNYSFTHEAASVVVATNLSETAPGAWVFTMTTEPDEDAKTPTDGCQPRTTFDAAMAVPGSFDTVRIVHDGETVTTVRNADTPRVRYLDTNVTGTGR